MTLRGESTTHTFAARRRWRTHELATTSAAALRSAIVPFLVAACVFGPLLEVLRRYLLEIDPLRRPRIPLEFDLGSFAMRSETTLTECLGPFWVYGFFQMQLHVGLLTLPVLAAIDREPLTIRAWLQTTAARLPLLLLVSLATVVFLTLGYAMFLIPGFVFVAAYSILGAVVIAEAPRPMAAMPRITDLTTGKWLTIFAALLLTHVLRSAFDRLLVDPIVIVTEAISDPTTSIVVSGIARFLTLSIVTIPLIVVYALQRGPKLDFSRTRVEDVFE